MSKFSSKRRRYCENRKLVATMISIILHLFQTFFITQNSAQISPRSDTPPFNFTEYWWPAFRAHVANGLIYDYGFDEVTAYDYIFDNLKRSAHINPPFTWGLKWSRQCSEMKSHFNPPSSKNVQFNPPLFKKSHFTTPMSSFHYSRALISTHMEKWGVDMGWAPENRSSLLKLVYGTYSIILKPTKIW